VTAAEVSVEKDDSNNLVDAWATNLEEFAQQLLDLFERWITPVSQEPKQRVLVKVNPDESLILSPPQMDLFKVIAVDLGLLRDSTILRVGKELGSLPPWVNIQEEIDAKATRGPGRLFGPPLALPGGGVIPGAPAVPPPAKPDMPPPGAGAH
jgi:hypothetical protein